MTTHDRDKIIKAAKDAGCNAGYLGGFYSSTEALERLYAIAFEAGRAAEREECAKVLEKNGWLLQAADAIRTRSTK